MARTKRKADAFEQDLHQRPAIKRVRTDHAEDDFSTLTFPQKLWNIVENETYSSIRWHRWETCVEIDVELFHTEILSLQGETKLFETSTMKSFMRQLNLYGFRRVRCLEGGRTLLGGVESASKKEVYRNIFFRQGHPELLVKMKRRLKVKGSGHEPRKTVFTTRSQTPQPDLSEEGTMEAPEMPLDDSSSQDILREAPSQTTGSSSTAEPQVEAEQGSCPERRTPAPEMLLDHNNIQNILREAPSPTAGPSSPFEPSLNTSQLKIARLQTTLAAWISHCASLK